MGVVSTGLKPVSRGAFIVGVVSIGLKVDPVPRWMYRKCSGKVEGWEMVLA